MNIKELLNNKLIICFKEDRNIFLNLKKEDPFLNFKLMDVKEVYERLSFVHDYQALVEIISIKKVNLKSARQILSCLRFVDENNDFDGLLELKNHLFNKGLLVKKNYQKIILKTSDVILFNQKNNKELQTFLTKNGVNFSLIEPIGLDIKLDKNLVLTKYKTRFEQFNDICNKICNLLNAGVNIDDIAIRANYNELNFYFNVFEDLYNLKFYYKKTVNLRIFKSVKNLLDKIYTNKNFDIEIDQNDENLKKVASYIDQFKLKSLEFDFAYNLLLEILDNYTETIISKTGILVTNEYACSKKKYMFELDFDFDNYPKVYSDDGYYIDSQIESLGMNPSYINTQIDNDKKKLFLAFSNVILTVCNVKLSSEVFMSTYIKELDINVEDNVKVKILNNSLAASKLAYKVYKNNFKSSENAAKLKDFYNEVIEKINEYDYKFKTFIDSDYQLKGSSYSSMNNYFECPFKYYCDKVLKLSETATSSAIDLGQFTHEILENVFDKDFDFEKRFNHVLTNGETSFDENTQFFFKNVVKPYIKIICDYLIERYRNGKYVEYYSEREENYVVNNVNFKGYIDSVLVSEKDGFKYVTVIDYKTGVAKFNPYAAPYGLTLQLPMYSLFATEDDLLKNYKISGLFIQPLFKVDEFKDGNVINESTIKAALKLHGVWNEDSDYIQSIQKNMGPNATKSDYFSSKKSAVSDVTSLQEIAYKNMELFTNKVNDFDFEIMPYRFIGSKTIDGCKYCKFRSICYRSGHDYRLVPSKKGDVTNELE